MENEPKRWLITGGCGFIGTSLVRKLRAEGLASAIRVVDNLSVGSRADLARGAPFFETSLLEIGSLSEHHQVELVKADIKDREAAMAVIKGADVVVHLAGNTGVQPSILNPLDDLEANVIGTVNYLEACRHQGVEAFILASSGAPIGDGIPPFHEEIACHPISPYGASKLAGEAYCSAYNGSYGLNTVALRFSNVYGPLSGHKNSVVARFINQAMAGEPWIINGDGSQTRDFLYIDDLTEAIVRAAAHPKGGQVFQVATQEETSVIGMARMLAGLLLEKTGKEQEMCCGIALAGDVARNFAEITKAKQELGWAPHVSIVDGLRLTVDWFLENGSNVSNSSIPNKEHSFFKE